MAWMVFEKYRRKVTFISGLPNSDVLDGKMPTLIILDDLMRDCNQDVVDMFTRGSHHLNLSVVLLMQNFFDRNPCIRTITLNTHYMVMFRNPRDTGQFGVLARQMYGKNWRFCEEAFQNATDKPFSYILIDVHPQGMTAYRLRTDIFPGEVTHVHVQASRYKQVKRLYKRKRREIFQ